MKNQQILRADGGYAGLDDYLKKHGCRKMLLVCGRSLPLLRIHAYFESLEQRTGIRVVRFDSFSPNPRYESVVEGVALFHKEGCDSIIAVGGGSAMDVAKCIKLYSGMDGSRNYLFQEIIPNGIPFIAVPTTAGTGSEATRYAVIYYDGEKQSVSDQSCIPSAVLFDPSALDTLPEYQKKATMLDAFCHAVESYWSVNSTEESKGYSRNAIMRILASKEAYLANDGPGNESMLMAANLAGKAINITQTTAGHAMCYKLTSLYGIAHGHAAALCVSELFPYMAEHVEKCADPRGTEYLRAVLAQIAEAMGCADADQAAAGFKGFLADLSLEAPEAKEADYKILRDSVNAVRLKNNPVKLDPETIESLYRQILWNRRSGRDD